MDHGVLNVPLAKRGDIDAQLDQYKRDQAKAKAAAARAVTVANRQKRAEAKALVSALTLGDPQVASLAERTGRTRAAVIAHLRSEAHWNPALVIAHLGGAK